MISHFAKSAITGVERFLLHELLVTSALGENITCKSLVEKMICHDPRVRPSTVAVLKHPMFWSRQKVCK